MTLKAPEGAPWEFLVVFAILLLGPAVMQRARIPGIIGLLIGGFAIGPHGLGWIAPGNTTVPELGQLGLLYLMFVAGVELDLRLLRLHRRSAATFGVLTFALPMAAGTGVGLALGWTGPAAILLGSLLASHTLIAYPAIRNAGLAGDPSVATAVGATVLTDTLALVVLAGVAGSVQGGGSPAEIALQIALGFAALLAWCLVVLPRVASFAFRSLGSERHVRYVVALTAFLTAATVAEVFGIEGIVGAFFAGLALNRLVPNEGALMDRIDFFGGAIFIPVFLVSVGLILDPSVMVQGDTLALAGLFILACLGGKALAAGLAGRLLGFRRPQVGLIFALTTPQAAATLAATVVGFQIGLFSSSVVNAVLVLILASVLASGLAASWASSRVSPPEHSGRPLGARVVVATARPDGVGPTIELALAVARPDGGIVQLVLVGSETDPPPGRALRQRLEQATHSAGVDGEPSVVVDRSLIHGAVHAGAASDATLVIIHGGGQSAEAIEMADGSITRGAAPVALVSESLPALRSSRARLDTGPAASALVAELARRAISREDRGSRPGGPSTDDEIVFASARSWSDAGMATRQANGAVVLIEA
ncbi:MAG: cation:proton antiporter [Thermoleophilaceae bacterium]|nr:cation:proton antiporter [Thermoleophilaceae bacterium]